jgi:hypothetical protein
MIDPTKVVADLEKDYKIIQEQRAEIARLRLTDEEREAIAACAAACENAAQYGIADDARRASTLRALLARTTL